MEKTIQISTKTRMMDITGCKYNLLTAIKPLYKYQRVWVWLCKCDCGKETKVTIDKLRNGSTKSCGCFKARNIAPKYGADHYAWNGYGNLSRSFYSRIKQTAEQRKIDFNVSIEYLYNLYVSQNGKCAYTGEQIELPINVRQLRGENNENIASLDRIDNDLGYIEGNLHWVCKRVNYMKHTMRDDYFIYWIKKIYEFKCT